MRTTTVLFLLCTLTAATAQNDSLRQKGIFDRMLRNSEWKHNAPETVYANPAMMSGRYACTLNELQAGWYSRREQQAIVAQEGNGESVGFASANAYIRKGKNDIWGKAAYTNGVRRNVGYNETSDYRLLYPYVTADLIGGNTKEESYSFGGGFAHRTGEFTLAASAGYRALLAYRNVDPRPKNLAGDLTLSVGTTWTRGRILLGLAGETGKYKQTNEVKFYDQTGTPPVYHATGLGTDYYRFRGTNTSSYYNGYRAGGTANFRYTVQKGDVVNLAARYRLFAFEKIISSLNELPMASAKEHSVSIAAEYARNFRTGQWGAVRLESDFRKRNGTENIFGNAQNNIYPQIGSLPMYTNTELDICQSFLYEDTRNPLRWQLLLSPLGFSHRKESYTEPRQSMTNSRYRCSAEAGVSWKKGKWLWRGKGEIQFFQPVKSELNMAASETILLAEPVRNLYAALQHRSTITGLQAGADYRLTEKTALSVNGYWQHGFYASDRHSDRLSLSVGFSF